MTFRWFRGVKVMTDVQGLLLPLSLRRLADAVTELGLQFLEEPDRLVLKLEGSLYTLTPMVNDTHSLLDVRGYSSAVELPVERRQEVAQWANSWNSRTYFGTAYTVVTDDTGDLLLGASVVQPLKGGFDDDQLQAVLPVAFMCISQCMKQFAEAFT